MIYKTVVSIDFDFSVLGIGCWSFSGKDYWGNFSEENSIDIINTAIDNGINFFDNAPSYGFGYAESLLGKTLKENKMRHNVFIGTKCGLVWDENKKVRNDLSKESIFMEVDKSLKRLQTDYIDLYQCHWPDPNTDIEETMEALVTLKKQGKIKYIGFTNFSSSQTRRALRVAKVNAMQGLYNMVERNPKSYHNTPLSYIVEREIFPLCYEEGMAFFAYSPLLQGLLAGGYSKKIIAKNDVRKNNPKLNDENLKAHLNLVEKLEIFADEIGHPLNQISLNFLVQKERVTSAICGASNKEQLLSNIKSTEFILTFDELEYINRLVKEFCFETGESFSG